MTHNSTDKQDARKSRPAGNPSKPPALPETYLDGNFAAQLYRIDPVRVIAFFDLPDERRELETDQAPRLFELLLVANRHRGSIVELSIAGVPLSPSSIARLNWFLHIPGWTRGGFRQWRMEHERHQGGMTLWKSGAAWRHLCATLHLEGKAAA